MFTFDEEDKFRLPTYFKDHVLIFICENEDKQNREIVCLNNFRIVLLTQKRLVNMVNGTYLVNKLNYYVGS